MARLFALTIQLHDRRYHGTGDWPPSPARVFQALVAGASEGGRLAASAERALKLLETLPPPIIAAPPARRGQRVALFVPNNDLDAVEGDPERVGEIRTKKAVHPYLLEGEPRFLYAWSLPEEGGEELVELAQGLYQLGRGVDPAWAIGEIIDDDELAARLRAHRGTIHRPTTAEGTNELAVPTVNSLLSLIRRFEGARQRLRPGSDGKLYFVQPPKPEFVMVQYDGQAPFHLFELRDESSPNQPSPWAIKRAAQLIERVRDTVVDALVTALPERKGDIERVVVGRKADGSNAGPISERVRFIPVPSIGHEHADLSIRRVLVQVPPGPLLEGDVLWALSGRRLFNAETGEEGATVLVAAPRDSMVERYSASSRIWRSITPLALSAAPRRRIDPARQHEEPKPAREREEEEASARHAVAQALRHGNVSASLVKLRVQREPFDARGTRAEEFAAGTRFSKHALWHVELELDREIRGPLVLGDGRFLGLGVMVPVPDRRVFAFEVEGGLPAHVDTVHLARALRRAVMARVQAVLSERNEREVSPFFHGHGSDGEPLRAERSSHLAFSVDVATSRLLIVPPHVLDGRASPSREEARHLDTLARALEGFTTLRAGPAGVLSLRATRVSSADPLLETARVFRSVSDYVVSRHAKKSTAEATVVQDVYGECQRRKLPRPEAVRIISVRGERGVGVVARLELTFASSVSGPLLLGKTRYLGGGLFQSARAQGR
jgi:CRISPR-associated protein Csb2